VQDTRGVHGVLPVPPDFVAAQMRAVLRDIGADVIKTGMLGEASLIAAVAATLRAEAPSVPLVLDPVMVAKGGARLLPDDAVAVLIAELAPLATLLTPNVPEAEALTGMPITDPASAAAAASHLLRLGPGAVLLKGGHLPGPVVTDLLATEDGIVAMSAARIDTPHTHGTGCTLASAIAAGLAQGFDLEIAVRRARAYVRRAIGAAPGLGRGHGPLGHAWTVSKTALDDLA
jgi:hydroxymethylpyrimidine/phosphomethylpyrimidine kinase